jgi:hypothetical protein
MGERAMTRRTEARRELIHSYGGGVQSAAIAVLIAQGKLPRPERIVMADTGREPVSTWRYLGEHIQPLLATAGLKVEIVPHSLSKVDLYGHNGDLLIPAFTDTGKLPTLCSNEWKRRPILRYLRTVGYGPAKPIRLWIGISIDEVERAKPGREVWVEHWWPLLFDAPTRRSECITLVESAGLPTPPRSSCVMCPHRQNVEWNELSDEELLYVEQLEKELQSRHPGIWLHRSKKPIRDALVKATEETTMDGCDSGFCFI